jgi:O-antigen ligase
MSGPPGFSQGMSLQTHTLMGMSGAAACPPVVSSVRLGEARRRRLLALLVATLPITSVVSIDAKAVNLAISDGFMFASVAFLLWHARDVRIGLPLAPVCCLNICSIVTSIIANQQDVLLNHGVTAAAVEIFKISSLWSYFYLGFNLVRTRRDVLLLLRVWIAAAAPIALSGVAGSLAYQHAGIQTPFSLMFRAQGTLGDSNLFAAHLILTSALTLLYSNLSGGLKSWSFAAVLLNLAGVLFAASRGGMMTAVAGSLFLLTVSKSLLVRVGGITFLIFLSLLFVFLPNRDVVLSSNRLTARLADTATSLSDTAAADRRELWVIAVDRFVANPFFGTGRGNSGGQVHNTYLEILSETGILGFATYVALVVPVLSALIRGRLPGSRFLAAGMFVIGVAGMTISIENYRGIWVLFGATLAFKEVCMPGYGAAVSGPDPAVY